LPFAATKNAEETDNAKTASLLPKKPEMYSFANLELLLCVCLRLMQAGFSGESAAFRDSGGGYWLLLQNSHFSPANGTAGKAERPGFLTEYGKRENVKTARLYLSEHGQCICRVSAVEILGMLK